MASAQDSTATKKKDGYWVTNVFGMMASGKRFDGGEMVFRRRDRLYSLGVITEGHLSPGSYGESPMPDHEEFNALVLQIGRVYTRDEYSWRTGLGAAFTSAYFYTDSVVTTRVSRFPFSSGDYVHNEHFPRETKLSDSFGLTATGGVDWNLSRFFWLGAEARVIASQKRVSGGIGLLMGYGFRGR